MSHKQTLVGVLVSLVVAGGLTAAERPSLVERQERQKQIQADTDRLVRRLQTMIRVLEYNRLDRIAEKALLDEVTGTLAGLSREQMTQLIAALERAGKSKGDTQDSQLKEAQVRHERIVLGLKAILARYDAVRSLEQAAGQLEKIARDQLGQYLQTGQLLYDAQTVFVPGNSPFRPELRIGHQAGEQTFVHRDLADLLQQVSALKPLLPEDQKDWVRRLEDSVRSQKLTGTLETAQAHLRTQGDMGSRQSAWKKAVQLQWQTCGDIQELSRLLRPAPNRLTALRQARLRLDQTIAEQQAVQADAQRPAEPEPGRKRADPFDDPVLQRARELSARQGSVAFLIRDVRQMLQSHAQELAGQVETVEKTGRDAESALRRQADSEAVPMQERVVTRLRQVLTELDKLLVEAERTQGDPLTALKEQVAAIDQVIREQQDLRDKAQEAEQTRQQQRLEPLAPRQQDLAERAQDLQRQSARPEVNKATQKATEAMEKAAQTLQDRKGAESVAKQDEALKALQEAKQSLAKQVEETEKRRQEIAKLEEADHKLEELIKEENKVADKAREAGKSPEDTAKLAEQQEKLTPPTRAVAEQVKQSAPEASRKVESGAKDMEAARSNLQKKQAPAASRKAEAASDKLQEARKELARAIEQKKGEEAAEQQADQPEDVDTMNAAQQIAKALEQTEKAAEQSQKAADHLHQKSKPAKVPPGLAQLQKRIAQQAPRVKAPEASKPADVAAEALEKGDLEQAAQQQEKALEQLEQAAQAPAKDRADSDKQKATDEKKEAGAEDSRDRQEKPGEKKKPGDKADSKDSDKKNPAAQQGDKEEQGGQNARGEKREKEDTGEKKAPGTSSSPRGEKKDQQAESSRDRQAGKDEKKEPTDKGEKDKQEPGDKEADKGDKGTKKDQGDRTEKGTQEYPDRQGQGDKKEPSQGDRSSKREQGDRTGSKEPNAQTSPMEKAEKDDPPKEKDEQPPDDEMKEARDAAELARDQKKLLQATRVRIRQRKDQDRQSQQQDQTGKKGRPSLAELQQQVADKAPDLNAPQASPPASGAAEALVNGDLPAAVQQQKQALGRLRAMAQRNGNPSDPRHAPLPKAARNLGQLADAQEAILKATESLVKSQEHNQAARAALGQAQTQAPSVVQQHLQQAGQELARAGQGVQKGAPVPANQAQDNARKQLEQALQALNNALAQADEQAQKDGSSQKQGDKEGQQDGQKPSQSQKESKSEKPGEGQKPSQGMKRPQKPGQRMGLTIGMSQEINERRSSGKREPDGKMKKSSSQHRDVQGDGLFIHLPPRQRELIKQALDDKLPPEYAALIQQYYVNLAREKPGSMPASGKR